jgi:hypothetical protein
MNITLKGEGKHMKLRLNLGIVAALIATTGLAVDAHGQIILVDLGNSQSFRGLSVSNPDSNGNYWNSVWSGAYYPDIQDITGTPTSIDFGFSSAIGTDSYNGPAGPTDVGPLIGNLANTDIDAVALGNLGGALEGAFDYYVSSRFEIQGLDPSKQYNLTFYGSHKFSAESTTVYSVYTDNTYSTLVDSTSLQIQDPISPWLHNRDTVATISNLSPQAGDILYVSFAGLTGGEGYLNAFQIEVVPEPGTALLLIAGFGWVCTKRSRR